jgi:hypothetical protein
VFTEGTDTRTLIPGEVLDMSVSGLALAPQPLRDLLGDEPTVLGFLRHFG